VTTAALLQTNDRARLREARAALQAQIDAIDGKLKSLVTKPGRPAKARDAVAQTEGQPAVPRVVLPEIHADNGRIDAQKLAEFMAVPLKTLADGLRLNYKAIHRNPSGEAFQESLRPLKHALELLHESLRKREIIRAWLKTPHPMLDGKTALEVMLEGKAFAVERLLGNAWEGVVS
jgi:hypothetical protein